MSQGPFDPPCLSPVPECIGVCYPSVAVEGGTDASCICMTADATGQTSGGREGLVGGVRGRDSQPGGQGRPRGSLDRHL